jgi:hypothetical protein
VVLESGKQACPPLETTSVETLWVWAVGYQTSAKTTTVKYKSREDKRLDRKAKEKCDLAAAQENTNFHMKTSNQIFSY